jgi:hypothetical protein
MAYSDFTLEAACGTFALHLNEESDLFAPIAEARASALLRSLLEYFIPLGTSIHTEKARSEFIVAPILAEVRQLMKHRISLFSGIDFNVDPSRDLRGTCDFVLAASPVQLFLRCPFMMVVEAENDNIKSGLGQCTAEMVAARVFNEREGAGGTLIHGAVTTGSLWKFLKLDGDIIFIDRAEYYVDQLDKILGIFLHCVGGDPTTAALVA